MTQAGGPNPGAQPVSGQKREPKDCTDCDEPREEKENATDYKRSSSPQSPTQVA